MVFATKRTYSESSISPPSSVEECPTRSPSPPRKRRFLAASNNLYHSPGFHSFPPILTTSKKRPAFDSEESDLDISSDETEVAGQNPWVRSTSFSQTQIEEAHAENQPMRKRTKRGLSEGFNKLGIAEDLRTPLIEEESRFIDPSDVRSHPFGFAGGREQEWLQPSSVVEPGEVGPAVWVGHAPEDEAKDGIRFTVLGEDGKEGNDKAKDWRIGVWKGKEKEGKPLYIHPSYIRQPPSSYFSNTSWDPSQPPKSIILYNPLNHPPKLLEPPPPTTTNSESMMESEPIVLSSPPEWFENGPRFEELPDEELDESGGMDID